MKYATAMVVLEVGRSNAKLLAVAVELATRMGWGLSGIAACQPMSIVYNDALIMGDYVQQDRDELDAEIGAAKDEFHTVLTSQVSDLDWHSTVTIASLCDFTVAQARSADLILCGVDDRQPALASRRAAISDIVMHAGRPLLLIPSTVEKLSCDHAVIAWKDTREARRAVADALPLLRQSSAVTIVEIATAEELAAAALRLADLTAWLSRHGITAVASVVQSSGDDAAQLASFVEDERADLMVAGAYGHSRLREWALGGVTRDLFLTPRRCALVSH